MSGLIILQLRALFYWVVEFGWILITMGVHGTDIPKYQIDLDNYRIFIIRVVIWYDEIENLVFGMI